MKDERLVDRHPGKLFTPGLDERVKEIRKHLVARMEHDPLVQRSEEDTVSAGGDAAATTVNFQTLRGVLLRRWMPGVTEDEV